ncbi:FmdB family zinc ribbon protein [Rhodovulum marinum]|uniref:Putative FmdB family regulatory protein n=1 Tax=Rhodovulum marinum TaxID=320662 RepID=A0A4R2PXM3_9RHOB|nr:zinc ribbon domain-containing protein [Rhodovulum marinum]TCP40807.1 putative FmdB family regulatory protein [Rhodovulum marinum]
MPIYAYRCGACGASCELLQRSTDAPPVCPECGGAEMKQLPSRIAPQGRLAGDLASARRQAAKEGHFSNYSKAEKANLKS